MNCLYLYITLISLQDFSGSIREMVEKRVKEEVERCPPPPRPANIAAWKEAEYKLLWSVPVAENLDERREVRKQVDTESRNSSPPKLKIQKVNENLYSNAKF